jgi:hypothetical protein
LALLVLLALSSLALTACATAEASNDEIMAQWAASAHGNVESRSFRRWDNDEPPEISPRCAKCHSTTGYLDFLGADGSTPGQVDKAAPVGTTIECQACHNDVSRTKDSAVMPSGAEIAGLGKTANCMECHQGRASTVQVDEAVQGVGADTVNTDLSLPNIHNKAAGPTQYGTQAQGGYEYRGRAYVSRYMHVDDFNTCITCHDAHSLKIDADVCSACHIGVRTRADLKTIRATNVDYDGDGDISEGIASEIEALQERLLGSMQVYAAATEGCDPLVYDGGFQNEAGESYTTWTPRLLKAAYNYRYSAIEPGNYAHSALYAIQLLHDSLNDLGASTAGLPRPETNP